nr:hypothetical protein [Tanacetum cinerariifolium]
GVKKKKEGISKVVEKEKKDGGSLGVDETPILGGIAMRVTNIDGKMNVPKSILKKAARNVVSDTHEVVKPTNDGGSAGKVSFEAVENACAKPCSTTTVANSNGPKIGCLFEAAGDPSAKDGATEFSPKSGGSFASLLKPNDATNKVHFRTLVNEERVESVDCVLPKVAAFVSNTWRKFGFERITRNDDGVYLFKFATKSGRDQVIEKGPWMIHAAVGLKKEVIMAIPEEEGDDYIKEVVRVEYEWKPPYCVDCKSFGHDTNLCPKREASKHSSSQSVYGDGHKDKNISSPPALKTWGVINEDDTTDDEDVFTSYGGPLGGGNQLEDKDFDFYKGYEDQVVDLDGALMEFRDFKLSISGVETPFFDAMLVQQQVKDDVAEVKEDEDNEKVANLEQYKIAQALEITKLNQRVRKLEKKRKLKSSGLKRRMHPNMGEIDELDANEDVTLVDVDAKVKMDANIQGRMDTDEAEPAEVEEVLEVVTTAKLMTEVVTTAAPITTASQVPKASAPRRRRGVVIQDPEEIAATSVIVHLE